MVRFSPVWFVFVTLIVPIPLAADIIVLPPLFTDNDSKFYYQISFDTPIQS